MNSEFKLPSLTAEDSPGQIRQLHSFLRQTVEHLNWALRAMDAGSVEVIDRQGTRRTAGGAKTSTAEGTDTASLTQFANIKGLIIKSADIANAYYDKIDKLLSTSGKYVASSDFGEYKREVTQEISASADFMLQEIRLVEKVAKSANDAIHEQRSYIQYGVVGTTIADAGINKDTAVGIEIGDYGSLKDASGTLLNQRFARFTAYGLELFGENKDSPVAYLSGHKLYITEAEITNAEIKGTLKMGGYLIDRSHGLAFKWVGRG